MKRILAMSKPDAICAIYCATAVGFFKGSIFSDFAGLFSSAFFLPIKFLEWYTEPVEVLAEGNIIRI